MSCSRRALLGAAATGVLAGCARAPGGAASEPVASEPVASDPVTRLADAFAARDRAGFLALFTDRMQSQAGVVFDNWGRLSSVRVQAGEPATGDGARQIAVAWRAGSEGLAVTHRLRAEASGGLIDALRADAGPAPVWLRHPVGVRSAEGACLIASDRWAPEAGAWLDAATAAAARARGAGLDAWPSAAGGVLVVELPADITEFRALAGSGGSPAGTGAYTLAAGTGEALHVVVNAAAAQAWSAEDRAGVLTHEAVHAATGSPVSTAPLWLVEGLAESVATASWPAQDAANARLVAEAARSASPPTSLPGDAGLLAPGAAASGAYALAELAVEAAMAHWGRARTLGWIAGWPDGAPTTAELTSAYLAELARR